MGAVRHSGGKGLIHVQPQHATGLYYKLLKTGPVKAQICVGEYKRK